MKKLCLIPVAICLAGCSSSSHSPSDNAATPPSHIVQPQAVVTVALPTLQASAPTAPLPTAQPAPVVQAITPSVLQTPSKPVWSESSEPPGDVKREQVSALRLEIRSLQNQRRAVEEQKAQFGRRHPTADAGERATGASAPGDAMMANYNQRLDEIDSQIASKERKIDDLMVSH